MCRVLLPGVLIYSHSPEVIRTCHTILISLLRLYHHHRLYVYLDVLGSCRNKSILGKALCKHYHGIIQHVAFKRLICGFGSEVRLQPLVLHHHHIHTLFQPLQLILKSDREEKKHEGRKRKEASSTYNIPCII